MGADGAGAAVGHDAVGVREAGEQRFDLVAEGVFVAVARAVQPPHRPRAPLARQRVEHRQHRGRADAGADQHDRPRAGAQGEGAARSGRVDRVADGGVLVQVAAGGALALDADPVAVLAGDVRERVAADQAAARRDQGARAR